MGNWGSEGMESLARLTPHPTCINLTMQTYCLSPRALSSPASSLSGGFPTASRMKGKALSNKENCTRWSGPSQTEIFELCSSGNSEPENVWFPRRNQDVREICASHAFTELAKGHQALLLPSGCESLPQELERRLSQITKEIRGSFCVYPLGTPALSPSWILKVMSNCPAPAQTYFLFVW